ncbi:MAG: protein phosphatase 2C domain-containing protein [Myxococcales bacterium]|nr:protein phosphatase 2C domain-containing protein [Myxococcales bacterium]
MSGPRLRVAATAHSVAGAAHIRQMRPCQDAHRVEPTGEGVAVAVSVADGHGSSPNAAEGAIFAVQTATRTLADLHAALGPGAAPRAYRGQIEDGVGRRLVLAWQDKVQRHGSIEGIKRTPGDPDLELTRRYGTTLAAALAMPDVVACLALGDGATLWVSPEDEVLRPLGVDAHAFADQTSSLCTAGAWRDLRVTAWTPPDEGGLLLMMSDGYVNSYADDAALDAVARDYARLVRARGVEAVGAALHGFLRQVSTRGCGDDVSLALIHFAPPEEPR